MRQLRQRHHPAGHTFTLIELLAVLATALALAPRPTVAADRDALFQVPDFQALPPAVQVISEKATDGVYIMEFYFAGAPFAGKPTRIYAFYARPVAEGRYPGVVQLHGAGLATLEPKAAEFYARNGFACISIDWCGPAKGRKTPRQPPYSEFESPGRRTGDCRRPRRAVLRPPLPAQPGDARAHP